MPSEKDLDQALEAALKASASFRAWFLSQTTNGPSYPEYEWSRSDHPWGKVSLLLPNAATGVLEMVEREG